MSKIFSMHDLKSIINNKHFRYGAPFFISLIGGVFCLKQYAQLRYDIHNERHVVTKTKAIEQMLLDPKKQVTIEEVYEEYTQNVDLDKWQNIRGPRPWEDDNVDYKELIEKRAQDSKKQWVFGS